MPRLAVLGQPVSHSRSPAMQSAALAELGLGESWSYEAIEVAPAQFEATVRALAAEDFAGVNVTVPHKPAALAIADQGSDTARAIGAANTLSFAAGRIEADNTDASGLIEALPEPPFGRAALVMAAGGSGRACAWALREAGAEVAVWNRTAERAALLADQLGVRAVGAGEPVDAGDFELIVNATTVGLAEANDDQMGPGLPTADLKPLPIAADAVDARHVVVDLVYGTLATPLVAIARSRGANVVDGLEILVRQGAASLRIWTGLEAPIQVMRRAAREPRN